MTYKDYHVKWYGVPPFNPEVACSSPTPTNLFFSAKSKGAFKFEKKICCLKVNNHVRRSKQSLLPTSNV